jgi:hypothetical protein
LRPSPILEKHRPLGACMKRKCVFILYRYNRLWSSLNRQGPQYMWMWYWLCWLHRLVLASRSNTIRTAV